MAFPKIVSCLVCDAIRPEPNNKFTLLGFAGVAPLVTLGVPSFAAPVPLSFAFCAGQTSDGSFQVQITIIDVRMKKTIAATPMTTVPVVSRDQSVLAVSFNALFPGPGTYKVLFWVDGLVHYETSLGLDQLRGTITF